MVNGPPCAVCGFTLRWLPQQSSWGCDRCQRMFPASGAGAPQQPAAPQQPSAWAPPQQQGFAPPQQQGFQPPNQSRPPQQQPGFTPPQQQGFAPPQQQGFAPPQQQGFAPPQQQGYGQAPSHPPGGAPNPYGQPAPNPYAPQGGQQPAYGQPPQQQPYSPQHASGPAMAPVAAPGGKKSGKGLIIGIAIAAVAIAGGVVAFVMLRGGGGTGGGGGRSAVVKSTLAALGDGDVNQLMKLSDIGGLYAKVVDCSGKTKPREKESHDSDDDEKETTDPKKEIEKETEKRKKSFEELVPLTKGAKIELVEIVNKEPAAPKDPPKDEDDKDKDKDDDEKKDEGFTVPSGSKMHKGCYAKVPLRIHTAKIKVKVTPKGESAIEQEAEVMLLQVGTGYWLAEPPHLNVGTAALEKEFTAIKEKVCKCPDAACASKLKDEFKESPRRKEIKKQIKALSDKDKEKIDKIEDEIKACEQKLEGGDQLAAMESFKDKMCACNDKVCVEKVTQEMTVWAKSHQDTKPREDDMKNLSVLGEQMGKCMQKVYEADTMRNQQITPPDNGSAGGGIGATIGGATGNGPVACAEYIKVLQRMLACPKFPSNQHQSIEDSIKAISESYRDYGRMPKETQQTIEKACKDGGDAMEQAMQTMGC